MESTAIIESVESAQNAPTPNRLRNSFTSSIVFASTVSSNSSISSKEPLTDVRGTAGIASDDNWEESRISAGIASLRFGGLISVIVEELLEGACKFKFSPRFSPLGGGRGTVFSPSTNILVIATLFLDEDSLAAVYSDEDERGCRI